MLYKIEEITNTKKNVNIRYNKLATSYLKCLHSKH
jgi:hypothetical protein